MKITFELPEPTDEHTEETLAEQFTQLVETCRAILNDYKKKHGIVVPRLSITLPAKLKKVKELTPAQVFTKQLLKHHMDRVPTAHSGKQAGAIARLYESGFTDAEYLLKMYDESVGEYPATSWFTVIYRLNSGGNSAPKPDDLVFQRRELDETEIEALKARMGVDLTQEV